MTLPSSISAPSTLVPMISAVSGSTTVTSTRISGGIANRNTRLRPIVARSVIDATTLLCTPNITIVSFLGSRQTAGRAPSGLHEVGEHALQRFILGQQFAEPDALLPGERGELPAAGPGRSPPPRSPRDGRSGWHRAAGHPRCGRGKRVAGSSSAA